MQARLEEVIEACLHRLSIPFSAGALAMRARLEGVIEACLHRLSIPFSAGQGRRPLLHKFCIACSPKSFYPFFSRARSKTDSVEVNGYLLLERKFLSLFQQGKVEDKDDPLVEVLGTLPVSIPFSAGQGRRP